jgi:hypothetical protein
MSQPEVTVILEDWTTYSYGLRTLGDVGEPQLERHLGRDKIHFPSPAYIKNKMWENRYVDDRDPDESLDLLDKMISVAAENSTVVSRDEIYTRDKEASRIETSFSQGKALISPEVLFTDEVRNIVQLMFGAGGAAGCLKIAKDMVVAYLNNKASRSITLTNGDMSITVQGGRPATPEQIERLMKLLDRTSADSRNAEKQQPDAAAHKS